MKKNVRKGGFGLLAGFLILGLSTTALGFGTSKFKEEMAMEQVAVKLTRETQEGGYQLLTTEELKKMMDSDKKLLIVDTMPFEDSYKKNHIPGAKQFLFPIPAMKEWQSKETGGKSIEDFKTLLGPDLNRPIVFYCGFVKCTRSHNGALWAKKLGYTMVYRQPGGIFAWMGADYPAESSP